MKKGPLSEVEKVKILTSIASLHSPKYKMIGEAMNRSPETIKKFNYQYQKTQQLFPQRGRHPIIDTCIKEGIIGSVQAFPLQKLEDISDDFQVSPSKVKGILNENKIDYFTQTPIVGLDEPHKNARIQFCSKFAYLNYFEMPKIIFTDESTVRVDEKSGGIWRERGFHPQEEFYVKNAHPPSVMVWGGIGPFGYKTPLLRFSGRINSKKYCESLISNNIFADIKNHFGDEWTWQQDNAPCHSSRYTKQVLQSIFPSQLDWPAKSPDLSLIEQVWDLMKSKLRGRKFPDSDSLYNALCLAWLSITEEVIHNFHSSFLARCQTCLTHSGNCLNGNWKEVHERHNLYRTKLQFVTNPFNNIRYPIEI